MECPYCNAENRDGVRFCNNCGKPLDPAAAHVFLCGNPKMIGVPEKDRETGARVYPKPLGVIEMVYALVPGTGMEVEGVEPVTYLFTKCSELSGLKV